MKRITRQSSGHRFRIWHFRNYLASSSVSANLLEVVVIINKLAKCAYAESLAQFAKSSAVVF